MPHKYKGYRYDRKSKRYRDSDTGLVVPKREIELRLAAEAGRASDSGPGFGGYVRFNPHAESDVWSAMERVIGMGEQGDAGILREPALQRAADKFNHLLAFMEEDSMAGAQPMPVMVPQDGKYVTAAQDKWQAPPQPIPTGVRSAMILSDYYCNTAGDVFQHIETPIDLSVSDLEISCPKDKGVEKMLKDLYDPEHVDMRHVLYQNWLVSSVFGSAYPMEVPNDRDHPDQISQVVQLPPKFMWVGYHIVSGNTVYDDGNAPVYAIRPFNKAPNWSTELASEMFMPMTYNAFASGFNEQVAQGWGLPVNPQYLHPIRSKAYDWIRYPQTTISRAFRSISTRAIYQEMRRALLEGNKNQLWLFLLGSEKAPPSPQEMAALRAQVDGMAGQRTGSLVWRFGLEVKVIAPAAVQDAFANEVSQAFTLEIFRDLGSNMRIVTGNKAAMPGGGGGDSGIDIDLSILLRRLEFMRTNIMQWEYLFRMRQADRWDGRALGDDPDTTSGKARRALASATVNFSRSLLDISEKIKKEILPLYQIGLYSPQTALSKVEGNFDTELNNKKASQPYQQLFMPPVAFNQTVTGPAGQHSTASTQSPGRPSTPVKPEKLQASWDESPTRRDYYAQVVGALQALWDTQDVDHFIEALKSLNHQWLAQAGLEAYAEAGGVGQPDPGRLEVAARFVNAYADGFGEDLRQMLADSEPLGTDSVKRRVLLYPQEGYKAAVVNLTNQAMSERGATHYQRVTASDGKKHCENCLADAQIIHGVHEPFAVMHPNDQVCAAGQIGLRYYVNGLPSIEIPVPGSGNDLAESLLGDRKKGKTRRKRI